jgi:hypothetical protein
MNEEELEIARAFVVCGRWVWLPGMLGVSAMAGIWRVEKADLTALGGAGAGPASIHEAGAWFPNISDPATLGCILQVVREAHGIPWLNTVPLVTAGGVHGWRVRGLDTPVCKTEAEALLRALQAAPGAS